MHFLVEFQNNPCKTSFFPYVINEWNKLDPNIRSSCSYNIFYNALLKILRPFERKVFKIIDLSDTRSPALVPGPQVRCQWKNSVLCRQFFYNAIVFYRTKITQ